MVEAGRYWSMDKSGFEMRARRKDESKNPVLRSRQQECMIFDVGQRDVGSLDTRNAIVMSHCDTCASYVPGVPGTGTGNQPTWTRAYGYHIYVH